MFLSIFLSELCYRWRSQVKLFKYCDFFSFFNLWWVEWLDVQRPTIDSASVKEKKKRKKKRNFRLLMEILKKWKYFDEIPSLFSLRWTFDIVKRQKVCLKGNNNCIFFFYLYENSLDMHVAHTDIIGLFLDLGTLEPGSFVQFILFQYSNDIILRKWFLYILFVFFLLFFLKM